MNPETKTYYVIKVRYGYVGNLGGQHETIRATFQASQTTATRFNTVNEALTFITKATMASNRRDAAGGITPTYLSDELTLVRLEESAGGEQRVVLGETEVCPQGAVVKYAVHNRYTPRTAGDGLYGAAGDTLEKAALFHEAHEAIASIVRHQQGRMTVDAGYNIVRVALVPGTPVITETVLS